MKFSTLTGILAMTVMPVMATMTEEGKSKLDAYFSALEKHDKAMLSVAIYEGDTPVYQNAIGAADRTTLEKITPDTRFRIGSISKTFTAVMVMRAVEQGKLSLEQPLHSFFPAFANSKAITLRHLLKHQSGLFNFTNAKEYLSYMSEAQSRQDMLERMASYPADFAPGEKTEYSNTNYVLLGMILENVYQHPLADILQQQIARPLGLENTYIGSAMVEGEARSYRFADGWQAAEVTHMSVPGGAGAIVSNTRDLSVFFQALFDHKLISEKSLATMLPDGPMGMGLFSFPFYEKRLTGHNGAIDGFNSAAAYYAPADMNFVVLSSGVSVAFNDLLVATLSGYFGSDFTIPDFSAKPVALEAETLDAFAGNYVTDALPMDIRVFIKDGQLFAQATGQGAFPLTAFANDEFRFEQAGIVMRFKREADNTANEFVLLQGGGQFVFKRN